MHLSEVFIADFFKYLKEHPEEHKIPKRYVARTRNLVFYYFIGWHRFSKDETEHNNLVNSFTMSETKADVLKTINYDVFETIPKSGPGIAAHLKTTVALYE